MRPHEIGAPYGSEHAGRATRPTGGIESGCVEAHRHVAGLAARCDVAGDRDAAGAGGIDRDVREAAARDLGLRCGERGCGSRTGARDGGEQHGEQSATHHGTAPIGRSATTL